MSVAESMTTESRLTDSFDVQLDARDLLCPEPLMFLRHRVREMQVGEVIHILATDPTTERDFRSFCHYLGHELLHIDMATNPYQFFIKKTN